MARSLPSQRGFSLVEIIVAMAIGLIGVVVIFQTLSIWESRKRTTSSGSDAQIAGTIAMYNLERDVRLGGMGFGMSSYLGCTVSANDTSGRGAFTFGLYPVQITQGTSGAPDTITVLYGNSTIFTANQTFTISTASSKKMSGGRTGFAVGDIALVTGNTSDCAIVQISGATNADGLTLDHAAGTARFNAAAGTGATFTNGTMNNLGPLPQRNIWQIRTPAGAATGSLLSWSEDLHASGTWNDVAEGIVDLQAEYGVDGNADNMIGAAEWTVTAPANWTKLRAVRVALLARSGQFEKDVVTPIAPTWSGGSFTMKNLDGSAGSGTPTDPTMHWKHYRFRVYEQVIPLRNVIWGTAP